jgi:hypothetical protein
MDAPKIVLEVRWNAPRQRFDVIRERIVVEFHGMKGGALAAARRMAHDLIVAGHNVEIIIVDADGSHVKDRA